MNAKTITERPTRSKTAGGSQTLVRGLHILEAVASGLSHLNEIAEASGLARSTTYRLASTLVDQGYLSVGPRDGHKGGGYRLGVKMAGLSLRAEPEAGGGV